MDNFDETEAPQVDNPTTPESNETGKDNGFEKPKPPRGYVGWVTACAFGAISILFGALLNSQNKASDRLEKALTNRKAEATRQRISDSIKIANLEEDMKNCADDALDDLEEKLKKAQQIRSIMEADYKKVNKEIEISKQNTAEVKKATVELKQAIKTVKQ